MTTLLVREPNEESMVSNLYFYVNTYPGQIVPEKCCIQLNMIYSPVFLF